MNSDFEELLQLFNEHSAKYLIVGGHAVMIYSEPRFTKDLDIWIEASAENAPRVYQSLAAFGAPLSEVSVDDFACPGVTFQMGIPPVRIDILMSIDGIEFAEAWPNRQQQLFGNVPVWFIGREELIRNKLASARPVDLLDVERLQ